MNYAVGDIQGCALALDRLLDRIDFSPSRDHLYVLGDLVNRGPDSLAVLRRLRGLGDAATCLLGNHDWHLLAVAAGVRPRHRSDTLVIAAELEQNLRERPPREFLAQMFGNEPTRWSDSLAGDARLRFTLNTLTRTRFVAADGTLEFATKDGADAAPAGFYPWFDAPGRLTAGLPIAFGHWSSVGLLDRPDLLALDTGCAWGGALTAARLDGETRELIAVDCATSR